MRIKRAHLGKGYWVVMSSVTCMCNDVTTIEGKTLYKYNVQSVVLSTKLIKGRTEGNWPGNHYTVKHTQKQIIFIRTLKLHYSLVIFSVYPTRNTLTVLGYTTYSWNCPNFHPGGHHQGCTCRRRMIESCLLKDSTGTVTLLHVIWNKLQANTKT